MSHNLRQKRSVFRKQYRQREKWGVDGRKCSMKDFGTDNAETARIQCARYAPHTLSNAGLRSHALVTLIDRDQIQLSYYDRSAIIISQTIDLGIKYDEILFIVMLMGCHHLTLKQRGILRNIIKDSYITDFSRFNSKATVL
ncbi:hypothetical protein IW262DRAFT_485245 [Armillaria fumosa]|nr:hypothetical protein IW262DRAFT_485245 [Armillaria fumosa]